MEWQFAFQDSILDSLFSLTLPARTALLPTLADRLLPGPSTGSQSVTNSFGECNAATGIQTFYYGKNLPSRAIAIAQVTAEDVSPPT